MCTTLRPEKHKASLSTQPQNKLGLIHGIPQLLTTNRDSFSICVLYFSKKPLLKPLFSSQTGLTRKQLHHHCLESGHIDVYAVRLCVTNNDDMDSQNLSTHTHSKTSNMRGGFVQQTQLSVSIGVSLCTLRLVYFSCKWNYEQTDVFMACSWCQFVHKCTQKVGTKSAVQELDCTHTQQAMHALTEPLLSTHAFSPLRQYL